MLCKYYLQLGSRTLDVGSAECIDVSSMIKNLDSIKVSYARTDLGGVVRKCGSEIEFTGKAYEAIVKGEPMPTPGIPESLNVLLHELRGLGLSVTLD